MRFYCQFVHYLLKKKRICQIAVRINQWLMTYVWCSCRDLWSFLLLKHKLQNQGEFHRLQKFPFHLLRTPFWLQIQGPIVLCTFPETKIEDWLQYKFHIHVCIYATFFHFVWTCKDYKTANKEFHNQFYQNNQFYFLKIHSHPCNINTFDQLSTKNFFW